MNHKIEIEYLGMTGIGGTLREAKLDAARKAERALSGDYTPRLLQFRDHTMLVFRDPTYGWCSRLLGEAGREDGQYSLHGACGADHADFDAAIQRARYHLAQLGWDGEEDESPFIKHPTDQNEFRSWVGFQKRYRAWRDTGANDHEAHTQAGYGAWPPGGPARLPSRAMVAHG